MNDKIGFNCNIYKIVETGSKSITLMINTVNDVHKEEIVNKLKSIGHKVSNKTVNNRIVKMDITNIDYETANKIK